MLSFARRRLLPAFRPADWRRDAPPLAILLLALSALIVFGGDRGEFYRPARHAYDTGKTMSMAGNLSPDHNFLLFRLARLTGDGDLRYSLYGRFPIGGTALAKLVGLPFGEDLSARLLAARALMLAMFAAAAVLAYLAVARLAESRWIALAAAALAFSGYYALYESDNVQFESIMDFFGIMLTFHGMVVFTQEGRFRQLLIKTCAALLLGWHVYAILLPFIAFGLAGEAVALIRRFSASPRALIRATAALIRSRYLILGASAALFGMTVLGFNLANEYAALDGETAFSELPSARSMIRRLGQSPEYNERFADEIEWGNFARRQFHRVGVSTLPYAVSRHLERFDFYLEPFIFPFPTATTAVGALAALAALAAAALARRHKALWAALALFGFCWALIFRHNVHSQFHTHEALFYAGVPAVAVVAALLFVRERLGARRGEITAALVGAAAAAALALSAFYISQTALEEVWKDERETLLSDFTAIRRIAREKPIFAASNILYSDQFKEIAGGNNPVDYLVSGRYLTQNWRDAPFIIGDYKADALNPLTPDNRLLFLYDRMDPTELHRAEYRGLSASSRRPSAQSDGFDFYLLPDKLYYVKERCEPDGAAEWMFLRVFPLSAADLPAKSRPSGYYAANLEFRGISKKFDGKCMASARLPAFTIHAIATGRYAPGEGELWSVGINPPMNDAALAHYRREYAAVESSGEPLIRSAPSGGFDVYMDGDSLTYLKAPCAVRDVRGRFFLSVHPADRQSLPIDRRDIGHAALNFAFSPMGVIFDGKCMIRRALPGYEIVKIETGQWIPGGERIWEGVIDMGGD